MWHMPDASRPQDPASALALLNNWASSAKTRGHFEGKPDLIFDKLYENVFKIGVLPSLDVTDTVLLSECCLPLLNR